jgi:phosphoserine phosphatase RsbU/P
MPGLGGDFCEIIRVGPRCVDVIAGDVVGKGLDVVSMSESIRRQFRLSMVDRLADTTPIGQRSRPADVVAAIHGAMKPALQALVTLCYWRIDMDKQRLTWVGCGPEEALLIRPTGAPLVMTSQHPPLGVSDPGIFVEDTLPLHPGDALFWCSNGLVDALFPDGSRTRREQVFAAVARQMALHATPAAVMHTVRRDRLQGGGQVQDDVTMVVVQFERDADITHRIELPIRVEALGQLRAFVARHARAAGLEEGACCLLEVASVEVFTNVVRHGKGLLDGAPLELLVRREAGCVVIELVHLGDAFTPPVYIPEADFGIFPEGGFGLQIIRGGCDQAEYLHNGGVTTIRLIKRL